MYKLQNGFTKDMMIEKIVKYNNGQKSSNGHNCLYSMDNDSNRCAVGCFIPDDHEALNSGSSAYHVIGSYKLEKYMPLESDAMDKFQTFHDLQESGVFIQDKLINWIHENVA